MAEERERTLAYLMEREVGLTSTLEWVVNRIECLRSLLPGAATDELHEDCCIHCAANDALEDKYRKLDPEKKVGP